MSLKANGEALLKDGIKHQIEGNAASAENCYRRAIQIGYIHHAIYLNLGIICKQNGQPEEAISLYRKALEAKPDDPDAYTNLGNLYRELQNFDKALFYTIKSLELRPKNSDALTNLGSIYQKLGEPNKAISTTLKSLALKPCNPQALINLSSIYKEIGDLGQALDSILKLLELEPENPVAHMNLGGIYKEIGDLNKALSATLKSLELNSNNPDAYTNLGAIYENLGNLDKALSCSMRSIELKTNNPNAINNINGFIDHLSLNPSNARNLTRAYEILLDQTNVSHRKLTRIFLQAYLPTIKEASESEPIISENNNALKNLATDWRFLKSLALLVPPSAEAEKFFIRLRKELLAQTIKKGTPTLELRRLTEALATQCFLNEYVYSISQEENSCVSRLIDAACKNQENFNRYLPIIGCYKAIHTIDISTELINNYPTPDESSKELITAQYTEPCQEQEIKALFEEESDTANDISQSVQKMYEENPYPRFRYSDHTEKELSKTISGIIKLETTKKNQYYPAELSSINISPKVLIAGCGTGTQVIMASRYKNAQITAIDLSSNSLAYAMRNTRNYGMNDVNFKRMDLLNASSLGKKFDVIECSGVLHHMKEPDKGLTALIEQLKPCGYIKLGLYSEIARSVIVEARSLIQKLGFTGTPESIKRFRKKILDGELKGLESLAKFGKDFYSLSECRDLCFHVQEHRYTTKKLQRLLDSHDLSFCGFMVPDQIKILYNERYPSDRDMTSLLNWGELEKQYPSTFAGMYQFWAQKNS